MANIRPITPEYVRSILDYDPNTGVLTWATRDVSHFDCLGAEKVCAVYNRDFAGKVAGTICGRDGYRTVFISGRNYFAHRIIWLIVHGKWPDHQIDHINGDKLDNRLENLRDVTNQINSWNVDHSRFSGAYWEKTRKRWRAEITNNGKTILIGRFKEKEAAMLAYQRAVNDIRGNFVRAVGGK